MMYFLYVLTALLVLDALRMRGRASAIAKLAASDEAPTHDLITAPGVSIDDATHRAASAYARQHGLDVLDLVPVDLPAIRAMTLLQLVDPPKYRVDRLGPGRTAGHAILVDKALVERAAIAQPADDVAFTKLAVRLKHYGKADIAIADTKAKPIDIAQRLEILRIMIGPTTSMALGALPILWALFGIGIWLSPIAGLVAFGAWQLQPLFALAGTRLRSRDLLLVAVARFPVELYMLARTLFGRRSVVEPTAYEAPSDALFDPRRTTCPMCDAGDLVVHLRNSDLLQHKPGHFTLERCRACQHIFQNPRLSLDGLAYYYKDFYDGLGESGMEFIFGFGAEPYHARARMMRDIAQPARWLDVGAGHGHFCIAARETLPETRFDGLDLSESIDEAKRRGWIDTAYRGLFPELAPQLAGRYDAISMSHYLEHTLDPRAEIEAAHTALEPGGCLLIEVPDPDFVLGRVLRRYWLPWFQPQHLHLLPAKNLERLLSERGFTPLVWHRGAAHQRVDFFFASFLLLDRIAPSPSLPWRKRGIFARAWRTFVWTLGTPLIVLGILVDNLVGPLFARARVSNTYRVVARKEAAA
jgi:SAM-dependent methyltransferase